MNDRLPIDFLNTNPDGEPMTLSEIVDDERRNHGRYTNAAWDGDYCRTDGERWPCRITILLDHLERYQRQEERHAREEVRRREGRARVDALLAGLFVGWIMAGVLNDAFGVPWVIAFIPIPLGVLSGYFIDRYRRSRR